MKAEDKTLETLRQKLSEAKMKIAELEAKTAKQEHRLTALGVKQEKLRTVVDGAQDALIMADNNGIIACWNRAAEKLFGYRLSEAVGQSLEMIIPERYCPHHKKGFNVFRETGQGPAIGRAVESEAINKDGTEFPVEISLSAISVRAKWHAVAIVKDITDRKRVEAMMREDIQKYRIMLQHGRDGIMLIDFETRKILEANQAAADLYGYSREELLQRRAHNFRSDTQLTDAVMKEMISQTKGDLNLFIHRKRDGTVLPVEISACSFMWKGRKTYCAVIRDVTDRCHETERDGVYIKKVSMFA